MFFRWLILIISLALQSACGWHLRGSQNDSSAIQQINLSATDIYAPLYRTFKQEFERRRITINDDKTSPTLKLLSESVTNRIVSYNTELDPAEDELTLSIRYLINDEAYEIQHKQTYQRNTNRASAKENEKKLLVDQMRLELASRILEQVMLSAQASSSSQESSENFSR